MRIVRLALSLLALFTHVSCSSAGPAVPPATAVDAPAHPESATRPALTLDEAEGQKRIERHFREIEAAGERNVAHPWGLAGTADYVASELEDMGVAVERQGYELDGMLAMNLLATLPGGSRGDELLLVGTHYDSPPGNSDPAGASNVALLLELIRSLRGARFERTVRFGFFALGEAPDGVGPRRASLHYLDGAQLDVARFVGFVGLGRARGEKRTSHIGVELVGGLSASLTEATEGEPFEFSMIQQALLPDSDAGVFAARGLNSVELRPAWALDAEETARLAWRLRYGISSLAGEVMTNDGTLTPLLPAVR